MVSEYEGNGRAEESEGLVGAVLEHEGYAGRAEFDEEAGLFHGEVAGLRDVVTFQGTDVGELEEAFRDSVDDYLEFCAERGEDPEKPVLGRPGEGAVRPDRARGLLVIGGGAG